MWSQPGKKLLFMGGELGQRQEWNHDWSVQWELLQYPAHEGVLRCVRDLNRLYRDEPALHELDFDPAGFQWIDANDSEQSTLSYVRWGRDRASGVICCFNFTPVPRFNYRIGVPKSGFYREILNTDGREYGGSGQGNYGGLGTHPISSHGYTQALTLTLPPLAALFFTYAPAAP